jgi:nucleoid DNA-binding protein
MRKKALRQFGKNGHPSGIALEPIPADLPTKVRKPPTPKVYAVPKRNPKLGRLELVLFVQQQLALMTKREAENVLNVVVIGIENILLNHLPDDGFELKLNSFCKFSIKHKPGIYRKIPFTGKMLMTNAKRKVKFVSLGKLRMHEIVLPTK